MNTAVTEKPLVETIPTIIGTQYGGGRYMGRGVLGIVPYLIIIPNKVERHSPKLPWNSKSKSVPNAQSYFDSLGNTRAMAEAGSELAKWALDLRIGGKDDWALMCRQDALIISGNIPEAGADFAEGGPEAFDWEAIWTSTQHREVSDYAWCQGFNNGGQGYDDKSVKLRGVAVRRELIP